MSITVELPPDLEALVRDIPNVSERVVSFLRGQVEHEKWRKERYSDKARRLLAESKGDAEQMKVSGVSREEMFARMFEAYDKIAEKM